MNTVYLTYDEYTAYGGKLPQEAFTLAEFTCRKRIDYLTDSRVQYMAQVPEAVKLCMMTLIAVESTAGAAAQAENPAVASYNTDGYSETYANMNVTDAAKSMDATIRTALWGECDDFGTPLLYRGVK